MLLLGLVMTAFAVYGVSRHAIKRRLIQKISRWDERPGGVRVWLSEEEWLDRIEHRTDELFQKVRPTRIGDAYDAPQYAEQFIRLADPQNFHSLHIRAAYHDKRKLNRHGQPTLTWVPLEQLRGLPQAEAA